MVLDVDLGSLRRLHPVHKGAPKGNPKALKNQHEFSQVDAWPMCLVPCSKGSPETLKNPIHKFMHTNGEAAVAPPWGEFNQCKIDVPKNMSSLIDFCLIFSLLLIFDFLKISVSPGREHYF